MTEKILTIDLNEVYKLKKEEPKDFKDSFFRDVYEKAAEATLDIINQTINLVDTIDAFQKERQEYNNIIAFTGDRGAGKTSAMVNYAQYLVKDQAKGWVTQDKKIIALEKSQFIGLPTIDPSLFEKDENIMEVMLAQMFSQFEDKIKNNQSDTDIDKKRNLLERFEKVYENLQTIKNETKNYDGEAIETLSKMAGSTKLRENFRKLVLEYIDLFINSANNNIENKNCFLVITIDDFDLNVKGAVEMSEQIRKYFMIPNVIILMAVNMAQLKDAKELSIRTEFKEIINHMEENPSNMTLLYLLKLIPDNRRLLMPQIDKDTKISLENFTDKISDSEKPILNELKKILSKNSTLEEGTYRIINFYTGLIILPSTFNEKINVNTHYNVIIYNMRKYVNLLVLIFKNMKTPIDKDEKLYNIKIFEQYFLNHIIENTIKYRDAREIIKEIVSYDSRKLNKFVIHSISSEFKKTLKTDHESSLSDSLNDNKVLSNRILNQNTNSSNLSIADVLFFANKYSTVFNNTEEDTFIDAIKMAYSIKMTKLVLDGSFDEFQLILGDNILSKQLEYQLITPNKETNISRQVFPIKIDIKSFQDTDEFLPLLYFTPFWGSIKNHTNKRNNNNIYYRTSIDSETSSWFNIFAFLPLQLSIQSTIKRLNNSLLEKRIGKSTIIESYNKNLINKKIINNNLLDPKWNPINLPIYSIDFIENILDTHYTVKNINTISKHEICKNVIEQIEKLINDFWKNYNSTKNTYTNNFLIKNFINSKSMIELLENNHDYELTINRTITLIKKSNEILRSIEDTRIKTTKTSDDTIFSYKLDDFIDLIPDTSDFIPFKNDIIKAIFERDIQTTKRKIKKLNEELISIYEGTQISF